MGKPLYADACTTSTYRISYARLLIEMDITRPLLEKIKLNDPKGKVVEHHAYGAVRLEAIVRQTCCQLGYSCKDQKKQKQDDPQQRGIELKHKQGWRIVRNLDHAVDNIDAQGRFLEQLELVEKDKMPEHEHNLEWQLARGKVASKKNMGTLKETKVDIGNAFKALVDTAEKGSAAI